MKTKKVIKKPKKLTIGQLQKTLWKLCREVATIIYPPVDKITYCYTCGNPVEGSNRQLGHFIAKSICGAFLKYDMRNLRWQCYRCNINLCGNGAVFYRKIVEEKGQIHVDLLFRDKEKSIKAYDHYELQIFTYKQFLENRP